MASLEGVRTAPPDRGWPDHLRRRGLDGLDRPRARPIELVEITGRAAIRTGSSGPKTRRTPRNQGSCTFEWPVNGERTPPPGDRACRDHLPTTWSRRARPPEGPADRALSRSPVERPFERAALAPTRGERPGIRGAARLSGLSTANGPRHRVIELVEITFLRRGLDGLDHPRRGLDGLD